MVEEVYITPKAVTDMVADIKHNHGDLSEKLVSELMRSRSMQHCTTLCTHSGLHRPIQERRDWNIENNHAEPWKCIKISHDSLPRAPAAFPPGMLRHVEWLSEQLAFYDGHILFENVHGALSRMTKDEFLDIFAIIGR